MLQTLMSTGAVLKGHFLLTSGRHSDVYLEKFRLLENPEVVDRLGEQLADGIGRGTVTAVLGAAMGGILLSHAAAKALGVRGIFAEREDGRLVLRRGFELGVTDSVLVVEDVITTGGSMMELLDLVRLKEASLAGVACLVDRSRDGIRFDPPSRIMLRYPAESWDPYSCPLCERGIPLEARGSLGIS